jgi:hypothetical protein
MNTMTDSTLQLNNVLVVSPLSVAPMFASASFAAFVPVSYASAVDVSEAGMGADAAAHVVGGWVSPCTLTVVKQRTEVALANTICTRRNVTTATKPANTQAKKWSLRPLGVQGVPPG